jgi:type I restriction enzyme S subunit
MIEEKNIPYTWKVCILKNIAETIQYGYTESASETVIGPKFLRITDIQDNKVNWKNVPYCRIDDGVKHKYTLKVGDIVFARTGATVGKSFLINGNIPESVFASYLIRVRVKSDISQKYISYFFQSLNYWNQITEGQVGIGQPNVNGTKLGQLKIPIAPLSEQLSIVSKLEELLSDLENGKQQLLKAQQQLKVYRQSLLKAAFEGKLTNKNVNGDLPKGWKWVNITDIIEKSKHSLKAGPFGSSLKKDSYVEKGYKIYGQEQVLNNNALYGDYYINEEKYNELKSCQIKPQDILISLVGTVGKVLILPENCAKGIINPRLIKISLDKRTYLPKLFKYYFESSRVKNYYSSKAQGTTMDVLNLGIIKTIPFPLPPFSEQQLIVDELEAKLTICNKIEETINQSLKQAESLRQSILKKAFEGRLS